MLGSSTLKALLENPSLKNPPLIKLSDDGLKVKKEDVSGLPQFNYGSAFLGPNLWDRSANSSDLNLEYMDLDEFLSENCIPFNNEDVIKEAPMGSEQTEELSCSLNAANPIAASPCQFGHSPGQYLKSSSPSPATDYCTSTSQLSENISSADIPFNVGFQVNEQDLALASISGQPDFDPRKRNFTEEELKPQPVMKKSKKMYVPEKMKDEKYWARRHKNNFAARRSRDARRVKENQIALRAAFLEKENTCLREELAELRKENAKLKITVTKYECSFPANLAFH
jgi:hypothetical protein